MFIPIINQVSSILFQDALEHKDEIDLHQRLKTFSDILVITLIPDGACECRKIRSTRRGVESECSFGRSV